MVTTETLASYLKEQILAERMCAARMNRVLESHVLNDIDRRDLEGLVEDEKHHAEWLVGHQASYPKSGDYPGTWPESIFEHVQLLRDLSPEQMIVTIYLPERFAVRTINRQAEVFRDSGDQIGAALYTQILGEERRHVDVTGRIMRNLLELPEVRDFYHRAVARGFRKYHFDFLRSRA